MTETVTPIYALVNRTFAPAGLDLSTALTPEAMTAVREARGREPHVPLTVFRYDEDAVSVVQELRERASRSQFLLAPFRVHPRFANHATIKATHEGFEQLSVNFSAALETVVRNMLDIPDTTEARDVLRDIELQRKWIAEDEQEGWIKSRLEIESE